jgi:hypothetical protein
MSAKRQYVSEVTTQKGFCHLRSGGTYGSVSMIYRGVSRVSAVNSHKTYWIVGVDPLGRNEDFLFFHPCGCGSQSDIRACDVELRAVAAELEQLDVQLGTTNQSRLAQISLLQVWGVRRVSPTLDAFSRYKFTYDSVSNSGVQGIELSRDRFLNHAATLHHS